MCLNNTTERHFLYCAFLCCNTCNSSTLYVCLQVLGDIIESLAGAILVDSGYNKEVVWRSIRPLLEPLVTPNTLTIHPIRELTELCQKMNYTMEKTLSRNDGVNSCKIEVIADGLVHQYEYIGSADKKTATRLACKGVLNSLKET